MFAGASLPIPTPLHCNIDNPSIARRHVEKEKILHHPQVPRFANQICQQYYNDRGKGSIVSGLERKDGAAISEVVQDFFQSP